MADRIEPALTSEQWAKVRKNRLRVESVVPILTTPADMPRIIALANAGLLNDDPRKITREWVDFLRQQAVAAEASDYRGADAPFLREIADALASYLPPETDT